MIFKRHCTECGKLFETTDRLIYQCSSRCLKVNQDLVLYRKKLHNTTKEAGHIGRYCIICGNRFISKRIDSKTCCKLCSSRQGDMLDKWHRENNTEIAERARKRNKVSGKIRRNEAREYVENIKKKSKCKICGVSDYRVLTFHHVDRAKKKYNIPNMVTYRYSIKIIQDELDKCVIVCQNCHTIIHHETKGIKTKDLENTIEGLGYLLL